MFKNNLFEYSTTPNPDLTSLLNSRLVLATNASSDAGKAEKLPSDTALGDVAIASAKALYDANLILYSTVQASRINIDGSEISFRAELLNAALAEFSAKLDADSGLALTSPSKVHAHSSPAFRRLQATSSPRAVPPSPPSIRRWPPPGPPTIRA